MGLSPGCAAAAAAAAGRPPTWSCPSGPGTQGPAAHDGSCQPTTVQVPSAVRSGSHQAQSKVLGRDPWQVESSRCQVCSGRHAASNCQLSQGYTTIEQQHLLCLSRCASWAFQQCTPRTLDHHSLRWGTSKPVLSQLAQQKINVSFLLFLALSHWQAWPQMFEPSLLQGSPAPRQGPGGRSGAAR